MIRPPSGNSPQYQRLPFTHNAIQAFLSTQSKAVLKAPQVNVKTQSSLERIKQNQLSFLRKKPSVDDMNRQKGLNLNPNNSQDLQLTPNTRIKAQQLFTKNSTQSPSPQSRLNEYTSLQGTSTKRFNHNPTGSMNVFTLQQQLSNLNKKADPQTSNTPLKTIAIEHSKSRSVVDSKENDFSSSNLLSTQESRSKPLFNQLGSPVISESLQSQHPNQKCSVHLDKKAKYLNEATGMLHCTKCAYQFALRQVILKELPTLNENTKKAKELEMKNLLEWMEASSREKLPQICRSQQNQVKLYYQGQIHQCEANFKQLQGTLQQAFQKAHSSLTNSMHINLANIAIVTSNVEQMYTEVEKIKGDIKSNWGSIIQDIEMEQFKIAMNGYRDRLSQLNQMMKNSYSQNISMMSMPITDIGQLLGQINERYQFNFDDSFKLLSSTIPLIPSEIKEEQKNIRTQPTPPKNQQRQQEQITAAKLRVKTDNEHPTTNFFQYFFNNTEPAVDQGDSIRANPSNSLHANTNPIYISFENKEIFRQQTTAENPIAQDIMLLQSYRGSEVVSEEEEEEEQRSCKSTPHSPASGQTKSQYERVTSTLQIKQIPEIQRERSKQTFRTLFETQPEDQAKVSPSTSEKFKNILNKVNKNQSKTQQFYQNMWPKDSSSPHRYESDEEDQAIQTVFQSRELNSKQASSQKKWPKNELSVPSDSESSQDGKINLRDNYQKTLFCSPTFKNEIQDQSQSD